MTSDGPEHEGEAETTRLQTGVSGGLPKANAIQLLGLLGRWVLGVLFIYMGLTKALHPEHFLNLVRQYELTTNPFLLNSIAAALPWFEAFCGILLLAGVAVRGTALVCVLMLVPFTVVVVKRALELAAAKGVPFTMIKFDCGCGGGEVVIWHKLIENCCLVVLACLLIVGYGRRFCARYSFMGQSSMPKKHAEEKSSAATLSHTAPEV